MKEKILHYPRLDTVLMVEKVLKEAELTISKNEILRRLPKQVMRQTLNVILNYLEEKGIIMLGKKGVLWIYNENPKMKELLEKSKDVKEHIWDSKKKSKSNILLNLKTN